MPAATSVLGLKCRLCGKLYPKSPINFCTDDFGPLEVAYDYERIRPTISRAKIAARGRTMWRYRELLPLDGEPTVGPQVGCTPLVRADRLADALGVQKLWVKNDAVNFPTLSFKDRVVAVALSKAREFGMRTVGCASTGNLANSVAAQSASAGLDSFILVPADLERTKIFGTAVYGAKVIKVAGTYDEVNRLCTQIALKFGWGFVNVNLRPFYVEGSRTVGFEIAEQLGWRLPPQVVVPVASGAQLVKIDKAFRELAELGLVEDAPYRMYGAQATGCAPVAAAFRDGQDVVQPVRPSTVAKSLAIGNPADGPYVLDVVRRTGGAVADVGDDEVVDAIRLLAATEGIFGETAVGVTLAVTRRLLDAGQLDPEAETVIINSGDGLKTLDAIAGSVPSHTPIRPTLEAFAALESSAQSRKAIVP